MLRVKSFRMNTDKCTLICDRNTNLWVQISLNYLIFSLPLCVCVSAPPGTVHWSWTQEQACPVLWQLVSAPLSPWTGGWRPGEWYPTRPLRCWRRSQFPWCRSFPNLSGGGGEDWVLSYQMGIKIYFFVVCNAVSFHLSTLRGWGAALSFCYTGGPRGWAGSHGDKKNATLSSNSRINLPLPVETPW